MYPSYDVNMYDVYTCIIMDMHISLTGCRLVSREVDPELWFQFQKIVKRFP